MYQALLTRKYLTSKIMPLLAMAAVMLSVATVLITWSVMGGFLKVLLDSGRSLMGDVAIVWPNVGFGHYDDLIERLEEDPRVEAASPMIESAARLYLPNGSAPNVMLKGVDPESFNRVTRFHDTLWWKPIDEPTKRDRESREDPRLDDQVPWSWEVLEEQGKNFARIDKETGERVPAAVMGIELSGLNYRTASGVYVPYIAARPTASGGVAAADVFLPVDGTVSMIMVATGQSAQVIDAVSRRIAVANEFQSGVYEVDANTVMVPLDWLQPQLRMEEAIRVSSEDDAGEDAPYDPFGYETNDDGTTAPVLPKTLGTDPARVTHVLVRASGETTPDELKAIIAGEIYPAFEDAHLGRVPIAENIQIRTWEDLNATLIASVKKETGLVLFVFGIVCFTAVFLVLAIFWSMVSEKTKDIGILRALGASTPGVAWLWLRYGAAIGLVGAALGTLAGYVIVLNINAIHEWLGEAFGLVIWDARVYYFTEIPREVDPVKAAIVFVVGVLTCLVGAAWPAWRAASMRPVDALRFE